MKATLMLPAIFPAIALGSLADTTEAKETVRSQRPNIILIVADDLGWGDLSYHGSVIPTPNIDRIAAEGIELNRFYTASLSSPTRCGLMTGRYPDRFRVRTTVIPPWRQTGLDPEEELLPQMLSRNGYEDRAIIGKWHMGHAQAGLYPMNRGFTHFYGFLNGNIDYFTHYREGQLDWHCDWQSCADEGYSTDLIAMEACRCIAEYSAKESPYFLYVAFNAPHSPYQAPQDEIEQFISAEDFAAASRRDRNGWTYRAMVSRMDKGVGQILDAVAQSGKAGNTLILFMSDNGGVANFEPYCSNGTHRGHKGDEWEGGVRNAAAIWWPDGFQNGRKTDQVMAFVDIAPTLAEIVGDNGRAKRPYDGISMLGVLSGRKQSIRRDLYLGQGAAVSGQFKYIKAGASPGLALKSEFFTDIVANPDEKDDLKASPRGRDYKRLKALVEECDRIVPAIPELPFNEGSEGFKAPSDWHYDYMDQK